MKNKMRKMLGLAMAATMVFGVTACGSTKEAAAPAADAAAESTPAEAAPAEAEESTPAEESAPAEEANADLSGSITMAGSTSMEKLANAVAESFMEKYPNVTVTAEFTGSSAGVESVLAGSVDIGNSSRALKESETEAGAVQNVVAIDGIAVVVDPANTVANLTKDQLISIYTGETTNWKDVGGADQAIVVVGREAGSGTRGGFEELLEIEDKCAYANELDSTGAVMAKVASTPGAIGYVSLDVVDDTVNALTIDGVEASEEQILEGNYILQRPFVMATKGEISQQNDIVKAWFDYVGSDEGKEITKKVGLIIPQ